MGLEVGTYISDLVATNPVGASDPKSQGDDHIRLIKAAIKATFPNIAGAVTPSHTQLNAVTSKAGIEGFILGGPGGIAPLVNVPAVNADWNTTTAAGWFVDQRAAGSANAPEAGSAWMGLNIWTEDANNLVQLAIPDVLNTAQAKGLYMRARSAGTWGAWRHIIFEGDITTLITAINTAALLFTNKTLEDATVFFVDNVDVTKKVRFEVSGVTTATTRVLTIPNFDGTIATLAGAETLTNKALNGTLGATTPAAATVTALVSTGNVFSRGTVFEGGAGSVILQPQTANTVLLRPNPNSVTGQMDVDTLGNVVAAGDVYAFSDRRAKKFIKNIQRNWANSIVAKLQPKSYTRRKSNQKGLGFIAQDVEPLAKELVHKDAQGNLALAYPNMVAILWEVVRDLQEKVATLEAQKVSE